MKILSIIKRVSVFVLTIALIASCGKSKIDTNPLADIENTTVGAYLTLGSTTNLNFNFAQLATSTVGIKVNEFKTTAAGAGSAIDKVEVYAVKGTSTDRTLWKLIKTVPFTGEGTALSVTGAELASGLGVAIGSFSAGDAYTFYNRAITKDGRKFDIVNTPGALGSLSAYNAAFVWQAVITCPFTAGVMAGTYKVIRDDWQDWSPGDLVQVTNGTGNQINLSQVWPNTAYGNLVNPLLVNVNAADGVASVPLVNFANGYPLSATAQGVNAAGTASDAAACGYVFSCTGFISLTMKVVYGGSNQGNLKLILQKQ
jgi:hypothetical protein